MTRSTPRTTQQRRADSLRRLETGNHLWIATASVARPVPHLVPLSFAWTGSELLIVTAASTPTAENIRQSGVAKVAVGPTDDVLLIDVELASSVAVEDVDEELATAYARQSDWDPREGVDAPSLYISLRPVTMRAWRQENEMRGRVIMRDGEWVQ